MTAGHDRKTLFSCAFAFMHAKRASLLPDEHFGSIPPSHLVVSVERDWRDRRLRRGHAGAHRRHGAAARRRRHRSLQSWKILEAVDGFPNTAFGGAGADLDACLLVSLACDWLLSAFGSRLTSHARYPCCQRCCRGQTPCRSYRLSAACTVHVSWARESLPPAKVRTVLGRHN